MTWNPDAPLEMLDRAARIYIELCGHAAFCNWLEQELPRVKIYLNYKETVVFFASTAGGASQPQPPVPPTAATSAALDVIACIKHGVMGGPTWVDHSPRCDGKCQEREAPQGIATSAASPIVEEMVETLRWYADMTNYDFEGRTVAPVVGDEGNRARVALTKYEASK